MKKIVLRNQKDRKNWIECHFLFDRSIIRLLKSFGRGKFWYDPKKKLWSIPENLVSKLKVKAQLNGIQIVDERTEKEQNIKISIDRDGFNLDCDPIYLNSKCARLLYFRKPRYGYVYAKELEKAGYKVDLIDDYTPFDIHQTGKLPQLYDFQEENMEFLREHDYSGLSALAPGLGKTIVAGKTIVELAKGPVLVVVPASLIYQWVNVLKNQFHLQPTPLSAKLDPIERESVLNSSEIVITNYELLRKLQPMRVYSLLILDEAHRIKNWKTQTAQAMSKIMARRVLSLTATPIENHLFELYNITDQTIPGSLGTMKSFSERFTVRDPMGQIIRYKNLEDVYRMLNNVMFRKTRKDVALELPKLTTEMVVVQLSKKELRGYYDMFGDSLGRSDTMSSKVFVSSSSMRMDISPSSKEKELLVLLENFDEQVVIMTEYKIEALRLERLIKNRNVYMINGDVKKEIRPQVVNEFNKDPNGVVISTIAEGIDGLQTSQILINFDLCWTHTKMIQRLGRIERIGGQSNILSMIMLSDVDFDWRLWDIVQYKKELSDVTIDGVKSTMLKYLRKDVEKNR